MACTVIAGFWRGPAATGAERCGCGCLSAGAAQAGGERIQLAGSAGKRGTGSSAAAGAPAEEQRVGSSAPAQSTVLLGGSFTAAAAAVEARTAGARDVRFFRGVAAWKGGQLEAELADGCVSWAIASAQTGVPRKTAEATHGGNFFRSSKISCRSRTDLGQIILAWVGRAIFPLCTHPLGYHPLGRATGAASARRCTGLANLGSPNWAHQMGMHALPLDRVWILAQGGADWVLGGAAFAVPEARHAPLHAPIRCTGVQGAVRSRQPSRSEQDRPLGPRGVRGGVRHRSIQL